MGRHNDLKNSYEDHYGTDGNDDENNGNDY